MSVTDAQFRIVVAVGGLLLMATIASVRFCGSVALPPKPPPVASQRESQFASPEIYKDFLASDSKFAGVPTPTLADMSRKIEFRSDDKRHVLEVGHKPIEVAGLSLSAQRKDRALVLQIENVAGTTLAYTVVSTPFPDSSACSNARSLPHNAMVVEAHKTETRVECVWRAETAIVVTRVETAELSPLSAWYLSMVPPSVVGIEDRVARAHLPPEKGERCSPVVAQSVRNGLERGQIGWRDLIDFYARHRCATYQFHSGYRALKSDGELPIPAVAPTR